MYERSQFPPSPGGGGGGGGEGGGIVWKYERSYNSLQLTCAVGGGGVGQLGGGVRGSKILQGQCGNMREAATPTHLCCWDRDGPAARNGCPSPHSWSVRGS